MLQVFLNSLPNKTLLIRIQLSEADKFLDIKNFCLMDVSERESINDSLYVKKSHLEYWVLILENNTCPIEIMKYLL